MKDATSRGLFQTISGSIHKDTLKGWGDTLIECMALFVWVKLDCVLEGQVFLASLNVIIIKQTNISEECHSYWWSYGSS